MVEPAQRKRESTRRSDRKRGIKISLGAFGLRTEKKPSLIYLKSYWTCRRRVSLSPPQTNMSDSAFRRLLLDTVSAVITTRPPSTSSLVELLRITTPDLVLSSSSCRAVGEGGGGTQEAELIVRRDVAKREKMYKALQLKIHPDKHPGDERVTTVFQDVTTYYERCIVVMESEPVIRTNTTTTTSTNTKVNNATELGTKYQQREATVNTKRSGVRSKSSSTVPHAQWVPPFLREYWPAGRRGGERSTNPIDTSIHSDYVNDSDEHERFRRTLTPSQRRHHDRLFPSQQYRDDGCRDFVACVSLLGTVLLCIFLWYFWLGDNNYDWDWDKIKRENSWGNNNGGP